MERKPQPKWVVLNALSMYNSYEILEGQRVTQTLKHERHFHTVTWLPARRGSVVRASLACQAPRLGSILKVAIVLTLTTYSYLCQAPFIWWQFFFVTPLAQSFLILLSRSAVSIMTQLASIRYYEKD